MRFLEQRLLWPFSLALATHSLLALLWPRFDAEHLILKKTPSLTIRLYKNESKVEEEAIKESQDQEVPEPAKNSDIATLQPSDTGPDTIENEPSSNLIISPSELKSWAWSEAISHGKQEEKVDLSTLREGSYVEQWLNPNRVDIRDSDKDTKISVNGGTIWIKKVSGKLICSLVSHDGKVSGFNCGDPEQNQFMNANGSIKNSDRVDW